MMDHYRTDTFITPLDACREIGLKKYIVVFNNNIFQFKEANKFNTEITPSCVMCTYVYRKADSIYFFLKKILLEYYYYVLWQDNKQPNFCYKQPPYLYRFVSVKSLLSKMESLRQIFRSRTVGYLQFYL